MPKRLTVLLCVMLFLVVYSFASPLAFYILAHRYFTKIASAFPNDSSTAAAEARLAADGFDIGEGEHVCALSPHHPSCFTQFEVMIYA